MLRYRRIGRQHLRFCVEMLPLLFLFVCVYAQASSMDLDEKDTAMEDPPMNLNLRRKLPGDDQVWNKKRFHKDQPSSEIALQYYHEVF